MSDNPQDFASAAPRVEEGLFVRAGGSDQWVTIRGRDRRNPVLFVVGGPGAALSPMAPYFEPWERAFTLVQWDQPWAGATWALNEDAGGPLTLERLVRDGLEVVQTVLERLRMRRLVLLGFSGGSVVGLSMAARRPDLVSAYVGTGQFVDWDRQEALSYQHLLERARATGDAEAAAELERLGPPPYAEAAQDAVKARYAAALTPAEARSFAELSAEARAAMSAPPPEATWAPARLARPDTRALATRAYEALRPELLAFQARRLGTRYGTPLVFLQGAEDVWSVPSEVAVFARGVEAPLTAVEVIPGGGHCALFLRDAFLVRLVARVRPLAAP